jgi:hypothetical protein
MTAKHRRGRPPEPLQDTPFYALGSIPGSSTKQESVEATATGEKISANENKRAVAVSGRHQGRNAVDVVNTFGVSAGRFALFGVVSRRQFRFFPSSKRFSNLVRFPAAPL